MAGTPFGLGSPLMSATTPISSGLSPFGTLGQGNPIGLQSLGGQSAYGQQPQHLLYQVLQILPQQLQQIQQLQYIQHQQLQQLIQFVPAQLVQIQQLIQLAVQQLQQTQQPLGQAGAGGFAMTPWGLTPQPFGAQPPQVM